MESRKINILKRWRLHFDSLSSTLALRCTIDRKWVDFVEMTLLEFWGEEFFYVDFIRAMEQNELHTIQALLYNLDKSSFYRVLEVCFLIDFSRTWDPEQFKKFQSVKEMTVKVRDVLCELLTEFAFREGGFPYEAGALRGNQILEGYATIANGRFLVECKNRYSMSEERFKVIRYMTGRIARIYSELKPAVECVGYINITKSNTTIQDLHQPLKRLEKFFASPPSYHPQKIITQNDISIDIRSGNPENLKEFDEGKVKADLTFSIRNTFELDAQTNLIHRLRFSHNIGTDRSEISKRLLNTIEDARRQHRGEGCFGRIFCIFNEFHKDLRPPLIVNSEDFVPDVERYLSARSTNDIVLLVDRRFNGDLPQIQYFVIGNSSLRLYKEELMRKLDFSIYSQWPNAGAFFNS